LYGVIIIRALGGDNCGSGQGWEKTENTNSK